MNESDEPAPPGDELEGIGPSSTHLHPLAPIVFLAVGLAVGIVIALAFGPALAVPLGLFGGGIGVWAVERGRRLR
jgi:hypothetical protein